MESVAAGLLSAACIVYNNTLNAWPPFQGTLYVPLNVAFATAATLLGLVVVDLTPRELGFQGDAGDVWLGLVAAITVTTPFFVVAASRHAGRIADRRVTGLRGITLAYQALLRVPLGTALTEEVIFRGVLFAAWRATGLSTTAAMLSAAAVFGLWHISPTIHLVRANAPKSSKRNVGLSVLGGVAFTGAAGIALTQLRLATDGLVAPIVLHAGTNSLGTIAAVLAARRAGLTTWDSKRP